MKRYTGTGTAATILLLVLALTRPALASDHQDINDWCSESQGQLAACILGALVVVPVAFLHTVGESFEAACQNAGGEYRDDVGAGYPYQYGCTEDMRPDGDGTG